jgi:NADPH-dependent glutamate synthase beta subunit-like oxidoreductase
MPAVGYFMRIDLRRAAWVAGVCAVLLIHAPAKGAHPALDAVIDSVLRNGRNGQLPPHLSLVLGIGAGDAPLDVKQAVIRTGPEVRVFNVCVANHKDIVILRTNEEQRTTRAYLFSTAGKLRKAVSFVAAGPPQLTPAPEAKAALADELTFWTELNLQPAFGH